MLINFKLFYLNSEYQLNIVLKLNIGFRNGQKRNLKSGFVWMTLYGQLWLFWCMAIVQFCTPYLNMEQVRCLTALAEG